MPVIAVIQGTIHNSTQQHVHHIPSSKNNARIIVTENYVDKNTYLEEILSHNQLCRYNIPPNHRPVCSLISQQHFHPRVGHDFLQGSGSTSRLIHSQGCKQTQPSHHSWVSQAVRENIPQMGFIGHSAKPSHSWVSQTVHSEANIHFNKVTPQRR